MLRRPAVVAAVMCLAAAPAAGQEFGFRASARKTAGGPVTNQGVTATWPSTGVLDTLDEIRDRSA